ncbi:MAG: hypothetical protein ACE5FN_09155 [Leptospirillia bacterium]
MEDQSEQTNPPRTILDTFENVPPGVRELYKKVREPFVIAQAVLDKPQFTQAEALSLTQPRLDSGVLQNWVNKGTVEFIGPKDSPGKRRLYCGRDVILICALQQARTLGLPMKLAGFLAEVTSIRAEEMLGIKGRGMTPDQSLIIHLDESGDWKVSGIYGAIEYSDLPETFAVLRTDVLIERVLEGLSQMMDS